MNIYQLRQFIALSQEKSISDAARGLHISQQALSKSIGQLEHEWNVTLFTRGKHGISLSYTGSQLLPVVQSLVSRYDEHCEVIRSILQKSACTLRLSVENEVLLNSLPYELISTVGNLQIMTTVANGIMKCMNDIKSGEADIALVTNPLVTEDFHFLPLLQRYPTVIMSRNHSLARKDTIQIRDLKDERHIWITQSSSGSDAYIRACMEKGFYPRFAAAYPSGKMILEAIAEGKGITIGFDMIRLDSETEIVRRPLVDSLMYTLGLLVREDMAGDTRILSYYHALQTYFEG